MIFRWLRAHASQAISTASVLVVTAVVLAIALVSTGYTEQKLELDDASVWVTNGARQVVGRANTDVFELNTVVTSEGSDIDVLQRGDTVLAHNHTSNTLQVIDPASSQVTSTIPLPAGDPDVMLADGQIVIHSGATGEVWAVRQANLDSFDESAQPLLSLDAGSVVAVDESGALVGFDRQSQRLVTADLSSGAEPSSEPVTGLDVQDTDELQIARTGGVTSVLDATSRQMVVGGRQIDLSDRVTSSADLRLAASSTEGGALLLAHTGGLLGIDTSSGAVEQLVDAAAGKPTQPLVDDGCSYAAWADGSTWQRCGSSDAVRGQLAGVAADDDLAFRSNGRYVVLNERGAGRVWAVQHENRLIDNWDQLIDKDDDPQQDDEIDDDTPPELVKDQQPPVATPDDLGARPGVSSILPVLLNDYDPNGDVLSITATSEIDPAIGRVDLVSTAQQLQVTLTPQASGTFSFDYTISDGRGGTASSTVTVTVRTPGENSAPVQARTTRATVAAGGAFTAHVLGDWYDPDGDPMYLEDAQAGEPDRVSFSPGGELDFRDGGTAAAEKDIGLQVSDFTLSGTGQVKVAVLDPGTVPILTDGFLVQGYTGQELQISPLAHVRGGTGAIRLSNVADYPETKITPNYSKGTFRFQAQNAGVHYLSYSVTDAAQQTATGIIRVDIAAAPDASTKPITVPTVAFLYQQQTDTVDVLASDIDPAGGVLSIAGVAGVPSSSGVVVEVIEHRILRVRLNNPLDAPVTFTYTATNGFSSSDGTVTIYQVPEPKRLQAPVAVPDSVSVRVGQVIDIPVVANDEHPNRKPLVLDPDLVQNLPSGGGLLFVSGNRLRYLAPDEPGDYTAIYRLDTTADVQFDTAQVTIAVREADAATNTAPVPPTLSGRVLAGDSVTIPVPLGDMDADGDSVRLVGAASNPSQGSVTVSGDGLTYTAGAASQGTDTFSYEVVDSLGARATGTVRVGISPSFDTASLPVAVDDVVVTTPGTAITVRVLENDSDPNASPLKVVGAESAVATVDVPKSADRITFHAPENEGDYAVLYTIQNDGGQQASAWLRVRVDAKAPPVRPEADDTVLNLTDIQGRDNVTVDVMRKVFYAEGDVGSLTLSLVPGYDTTASVMPNNRVRVAVQQKGQIIPFVVSRADDASVSASAFIWVPGLEDALPELRTTAKPLQVLSGDTLSININDYVVAAGGRQVRLTDEATVKASNADGTNLVVDPRTLRFTSRDGYWGPASLSFEVTDGSGPDDPNGHKAVIVLAITVTPRDNQPPVFSGAQLGLQPGDDRVIELRDLTKYPYPADMDQLVYALNSQPGSGFSASLSGTQLTVAAAADAKVGSGSELTVGVRDAKNEGKAGIVRVSVVTSTRPLVSPGADSLTIRRGETASIPVLENDSATNPFPDKPLTVVAVQGAVPAGVQVTPSADKSTLSVAVSPQVDLKATGQVTMQYQVDDATKDPARATWGTVTITIVDVPDQPVAPVVSGAGFVNGQLSVSAAPLPYPNGAPITSFIIRSDDNGGYSKDCGASATCLLTDLQAGKNYTFYSIAVNQYGQSAPSARSVPMRSDYIPAPPQQVTIAREAADQGQSNEGYVVVSWKPIADPSPGSAVQRVRVQIGGSTIDVDRSATSLRYKGVPGTEYTAEVWAENGADALYPGQIPWNRSNSGTVTAAGRPSATAVTATIVDDAGSVRVDWSAFGANGGSGVSYSVARYSATASVPSCGQASGSPNVSPGVVVPSAAGDVGSRFVYVVYADNGWGCSSAQTGSVRVLIPPAPPTVTLKYQQPVAGRYGVAVDQATPVKLPNTADSEYTIQVSGGGAVSAGSPLTGPGPWTFTSCISSDGTTRCSEAAPPTSALTPVNANATVVSCVAGSAVSATLESPGSVSWTFQYSFRSSLGGIPGFWSAWSDDATAPALSGLADSQEVVVRTIGNGGDFTSGTDQNELRQRGSGKVCG
ncbi:tandem-95 repeat protein [Agreia pratensis]|uniref:Ig-like domain-containing protein n=1 Tax=Agreia pratensis TaxID=150121 RepID=UPI00188A4A91|nr:Ig-like domain-containing protein [Agreia pratensis]MBF4635385.1 tandem-95 repeat protein [Agreia pratensis]